MITGECPSEDQLVRMVEGALASDSLVGIEAHINTCEMCMAVVTGLGALNEPPKVRTAVDRYQLDRKIGGGGMGEVWAAWDPKLRREVAVKLVRPDRADDGKERTRLLREAQALARLTHPNVVAVHDVGEIDGEVFIATELVTGDTLASRGGASVDWKTIVGLYAQAARGLAAAHAVGLVHRDVKPSNLLVGIDGRVRVADFGLAVRADSNRVQVSPLAVTETPSSIEGSGLTMSNAGQIAGTPAYMAPEQRVGDPPEAPADQFALCVSLGEAIAGRRPPIATTREAMIAFVAERRPREPGLDELCAIIARGTSFEPSERFPDMATLAGLLEELVGIRAPAPAPPKVEQADDRAAATAGTTLRVRTSAKRNIAIAVVALAVVGTGTALYLRDKKAPAATTASERGATGSAPVGSSAPPETLPDSRATAGSNTATSPAPTGSDTAASPTGGTTAVSPTPTGSGTTARPTSDKTVRRPPPTRVANAIPDDPPGSSDLDPDDAPPTGGGAADGSGTAPAPAGKVITLDHVAAAIKRRDGKLCRAALSQLTQPPPTDFRVMSMHAICEMLAGNCEGGLREQRALNLREGTPESAAEIIGDLYCPPGNDPAVRLRRISKQISMFSASLDCDYYLPQVRAAAKIATDKDTMVMGGLLREIAHCYSRREDCKTARTVLAEAQVFIPALQLNELTAACR